jgi:hypothetical protein
MSSSQSYNSGFGSGTNSFGQLSNNNSSMTSGFGSSSGWNAFSSAPQQHQQQQQQPKPDLSAFDSLLPMAKPKQSLTALKPTTSSTTTNNVSSPQLANYFQSASSLPANNGILFPQPASNVKSLSPSDINDLLS